MPTPRTWPFIATKEHRRFVEFAETVKRDRTIGICYGAAGIGKTLSASRYARWDKAEPLLRTWGPREDSDNNVYAALARSRTVFYTPTVSPTLREIRDDLRKLHSRVNICIDQHLHVGFHHKPIIDHVELWVIDESERLSATAVEHLRDQFDRGDHGLLFIGMPGIEKTFSRYPQLYSRVGFAHHYRPLSGEELTFVLARHWHKLGSELNSDDFTDAQAIAAVARITGGNFRLLQRLFAQIHRILRINELHTITADVVETARSTLVVGAT
ncbi:Potential ATP-binding protein [Rhodococcus sp. RD6.2]|uniref:AAA family ATPase n=1 Tax=Rhodococcus sp. RD6.2 TaxID=260936 RepID=UPI00063B2F94|nr:AAA family ATPase [Rhodococcus sp. RD6.2]CRK54567.1 Potential ATP-binding protein [Rhodococcus sp. RD6.2]